MESLLPFLLFSFVASITPGPTNILVMSHSSRRGLTATVPIIFGACVSAAPNTLKPSSLDVDDSSDGGVLRKTCQASQLNQSTPAQAIACCTRG